MDLYAYCTFSYFSLCVRVVSSTRSGMGKSLFISRMVESQRLGDMDECVTIPIHGPVVSSDIVLDFLSPHITSHCTSFHFDIAPRVSTHELMLCNKVL